MKSKVKVPKLSHEEICALVVQAQAGDTVARAKIIDANIGLVWRLAMEQVGGDYRKAQEILACGIGGNDPDAITSGLARAIELFDVTRGMKFGTYARHWIKTALRDATLDANVTRGDQELHWQIRKASTKLRHILGRDPSCEEIAEHLNRHWASEEATKRVSPKKVESLLSIALVVTTDPTELEQIEYDGASVLTNIGRKEDIEQILECVTKLEQHEREVIERAFGLNGFEEMPLTDIGRELGIDRHTVATYVEAAKRKIKKLMRS
jgi:RNA polymerase sigma factor (sigma-70 family)